MDVKKCIEELKSFKENLGLIENRMSKRLEKAIDGSLIVSKTRGRTHYTQLKDDKRIYLAKSKEDTVRKLEEKLYYSKICKTAKKNQAVLKKAIKQLESIEDINSIYLKLPVEKRHLIEPYVFVKNQKIIDGFSEPFYEGRLEKSNYITVKGEKVRSKSELIIADRFTSKGVLYTYEPPTLLDEDDIEIWHPDFMCLNYRTGEIYYWEHFGMLDNNDYMNGFQHKIERYTEVGKFIGKKIIFTTESKDHPLNTKQVDRLIEEYLL